MDQPGSNDTVVYETDKDEGKHGISSALDKKCLEDQITPFKTKAQASLLEHAVARR